MRVVRLARSMTHLAGDRLRLAATLGFSRRILCAACAAASMLAASRTAAQVLALQRDPDSFINQQRLVQEQLRPAFDAELTAAQRLSFDYGGWYSFYYFQFDDGIESSRTLRRHDLRLWARLGIEQSAHQFYVRGRLSLLDFNHGDSFDGNEDDVEGMNLERGFYRFDLSRALSASGAGPPPINLVVRAGRDLVQFGHGIALATPLDHVSLTATGDQFATSLLAGKTVGSGVNFDVSRTGSRLRRTFLGGQIEYLGYERHRPFGYVLWQRDRNREGRLTPFGELKYDSFHAGLGATGELTSSLSYALEAVYQSGTNSLPGPFANDKQVDAWAFLGGVQHLSDGPHRTRISAEYLFGSGDSDRTVSPVASSGGNRLDHVDTGFIGFGWRDTGLSFAPRQTNLHMGRVGGSFFPFPDDPTFSRLEVGSDWYLFHKHHRDGAVSDPTAGIASGYLGWEMDYYVNWRVRSDLFWTARLGAFFPGKAFEDRTTRTFLLLGMTWSF